MWTDDGRTDRCRTMGILKANLWAFGAGELKKKIGKFTVGTPHTYVNLNPFLLILYPALLGISLIFLVRIHKFLVLGRNLFNIYNCWICLSSVNLIFMRKIFECNGLIYSEISSTWFWQKATKKLFDSPVISKWDIYMYFKCGHVHCILYWVEFWLERIHISLINNIQKCKLLYFLYSENMATLGMTNIKTSRHTCVFSDNIVLQMIIVWALSWENTMTQY